MNNTTIIHTAGTAGTAATVDHIANTTDNSAGAWPPAKPTIPTDPGYAPQDILLDGVLKIQRPKKELGELIYPTETAEPICFTARAA